MSTLEDMLNPSATVPGGYRFIKPYYGWALVTPRLFRFRDGGGVDGCMGDEYPELLLEAYQIKRFTPKGYWVDVWGQPKFVLRGGPTCEKRFAYADPVYALESYLIRKRWHISRLERQLARAKGCEAIARGLVK